MTRGRAEGWLHREAYDTEQSRGVARGAKHTEAVLVMRAKGAIR